MLLQRPQIEAAQPSRIVGMAQLQLLKSSDCGFVFCSLPVYKGTHPQCTFSLDRFSPGIAKQTKMSRPLLLRKTEVDCWECPVQSGTTAEAYNSWIECTPVDLDFGHRSRTHWITKNELNPGDTDSDTDSMLTDTNFFNPFPPMVPQEFHKVRVHLMFTYHTKKRNAVACY